MKERPEALRNREHPLAHGKRWQDMVDEMGGGLDHTAGITLAAEAKAAGLKTPEIDRLYYIASHLELERSRMKDWKLPLVSMSENVRW